MITVDTVSSFKLIVGSQYYATRDYFWVPGALKDFDLPDLVALVSPRPAYLIDLAVVRRAGLLQHRLSIELRMRRSCSPAAAKPR